MSGPNLDHMLMFAVFVCVVVTLMGLWVFLTQPASPPPEAHQDEAQDTSPYRYTMTYVYKKPQTARPKGRRRKRRTKRKKAVT